MTRHHSTAKKRSGLRRKWRRILWAVRGHSEIKIDSKTFRIPYMPWVVNNPKKIVRELWMNDVLAVLLEESNVFLDIGVNLGQTLLKVRCVNPETTYIGIEAQAESVAFVNALIKQNNLKNCSVICAALGREGPAFGRFFVHDDMEKSSESTLFPEMASVSMRDPETLKQCRLVPVVPLDYLLGPRGLNLVEKVGVVKLDVEGAEYDVLVGAKCLLESARPVILVEILPVQAATDSDEINFQRKMKTLFETKDYEFFQIRKNDNRTKTVGLKNVEEWPLVMRGNSPECRDYLAIPNEKTDSILSRFDKR